MPFSAKAEWAIWPSILGSE